MAFTEWIGISFPVIVPVVVMDLRRVFVFFGDGVSGICIDPSRGAVFHRPVLHMYFIMLRGNLTLIHTMNAFKPPSSLL